MSKMHSELWEQLRMSLLIESGSGVPEEVMFPVQPKEGLDEPSKSIGWGTGRRADGQGYVGNNHHGFIINSTGQWVYGRSQVFSLCLDIVIIKKKKNLMVPN